MNIKGIHDPRSVQLCGLLTDADELGNLASALAFGDQLQHLPQARSERVISGNAVNKCLRDDVRCLGGQVHAAAIDFADRVDQIRDALRFYDVAAHTGLERSDDVLFVRVTGEEDDAETGALGEERPRAVDHRFGGALVEDHDIRSANRHEADRRILIVGFAGDLETGALQESTDTFPHNEVITYEQDAGHQWKW